MRRHLLLLSSAAVLAIAVPAAAQTRPAAPPPHLAIRADGFVGMQHFSASRTFRAILDSANGPVYGGGADIVFGHIFARVDVSHFGKSGERAFVSQGQVFRLGIPLDIAITPITVTAGYRGMFTRSLAGYVGGGAGSWHYSEKSDDPAEDVSFSKIGYLAVGGVEWRLQKWVALAFEGQYSAVPNAIGKAGVSAAFNEKDLGGGSAIVRILVGR